jgi:hypothetical protein
MINIIIAVILINLIYINWKLGRVVKEFNDEIRKIAVVLEMNNLSGKFDELVKFLEASLDKGDTPKKKRGRPVGSRNKKK